MTGDRLSSGSSIGVWKAIGHQSADVIAVHEYRDQYSKALEGSPSYEDRDRLRVGLGS